MSLGFQRLNVKKTPPNDRIAFIKPLPGNDEEVAQDFLERIAAQCFPIMKRNYLSVRSLEEYEPNREFVGRNFNAGEVIQLVLKSQSGRWLPFNYVQMVMMHELAHCKQMNHSKAFWAVRNGYARDMEGLWREKYTGEGLWGRGRELSSGLFRRATIQADDVLPEHICGGTYRTNRSRKRKAKDTLTWKERKEKRILKKFGANGMALGSDEDTKVKLEQGRKPKGKPRVAQSQRGRELRAAAALARFEEGKKVKEAEEAEVIKIESDESEDEGALVSIPDAVDIDGKKLVDKDGAGMVKVCGDEDEDGDEASEEMRELLRSFGETLPGERSQPGPAAVKTEPGAVKKEPRAQPTVAEMFREARARKASTASEGGKGEK